jgi:ABC-2 type transport system permease protein
MRWAIFMIMLRSLLRDRGALAMSFILPGIVFAIFAVIFSGASGGALSVRVAVADLRSDAASSQFIEQLFANENIRRIEAQASGREAVRAMVRDGASDVGLVVRALDGPLSQPTIGGEAHIEMITDPSREIASSMLSGLIQQAYVSLLPATSAQTRFFDRTAATPDSDSFSAVAYYAGAVAVMFLLFSSLTQALTYLDERESGLLERIASGPGRIAVVIDGKFLFMVVLGWVQVLIVFLVAWLVFGLDLPAHLGPWAVTTLAAAIAASGLAIAFVTLCRTRKQADTLGQMLVLVVSALGGSMVPRFLMPPEIQAVGWLTPNTWALEVYASLFWRGDRLDALFLPWAVLAGIGLAALIVARLVALRARIGATAR